MQLDERYSAAQQKIIAQYFNCLRDGRKSGKISDNIIRAELKYWERFSVDVVIEALHIHISKYPTHREQYTRGIMRNLEQQGFVQKNTMHKASGYVPVKEQSKDRQEELRKELAMLAAKKKCRMEGH